MAAWDRPTKKRKKKDPAKMDHEHGREVFTIIQSTIIYKTKDKKKYTKEKKEKRARERNGVEFIWILHGLQSLLLSA